MAEAPKFEVYRGNVNVTNLDKLCKPLKTMLRRNKKEGMLYLLYVYFVSDLSADNTIGTVKDEDKIGLAKDILFGNKNYKFTDEWEKKTSSAIKCYKTHIVEQFRKEMHVYDKKLDQLGELLDESVPVIDEIIDDDGNTIFSSNIDIINKILKDIINIIQTKTTLESMHASGDLHRELYSGGSSSVADKQLIKVDTNNDNYKEKS